MLREIYNKDPEDPNYKEDQLEVTDPLEACVGKIKMMIFTRRGEVLGDPSFGLDLESLIYDMNLSEASVKKELQNNIVDNCLVDIGTSSLLLFVLTLAKYLLASIALTSKPSRPRNAM